MKRASVEASVAAEADLAAIWQAQGFDTRHLRTTAGLSLAVVYPGRLAGGAGPDFRQAILALADGSLLRGDVELHLDEGDWWQHGHDRDAAYNSVALHVVVRAGRPAVKANGEPVPTLVIGSRLAVRPARVPGLGALPCRSSLAQTPEALPAALERLALERFREKQAIFEGALAVEDSEQALYAALMEALGYSANREGFRQLAGMAPLAVLQGLAEARPRKDRAGYLRRLLLYAAGLDDDPAFDGFPRLSAAIWRRHGVRPRNLPEARIAGVAPILAQSLPAGLEERLLAPLEKALQESSGAAAVRRAWQEDLAALGAARADEIAINVILPFAAALGQTTCRYLLEETALRVWRSFPAAGANHVTRYMLRDVLAPAAGRLPHQAAFGQALLHVWKHWCREKVCARCPLARIN